MDRYIVISSHTEEDCRMAIKHFIEHHASFLTHFEWGCYDNDHSAYAIIEAENHDQALMSVPPLFRNKAKVIKTTRFEPKSLKDAANEAET